MRKICQVIGIGQRKMGISKKGNKYDFREVSLAYQQDGVEGLYCFTVPIDTALMTEHPFAVNDSIDVIMHHANFKTYVDAIV